MPPDVRYPAGPITPHGAYHLLKGDIPDVALRAYDDSVVFNLMGGLSIPDRTVPESAQIDKEGLKGLIPPWQMIDQKGATQDGTTFIDALYDPIEVTMTVNVHGRNPVYTRKIVRDLIASIDAKQTSELSWFTHEQGRWWSDVRWFKTAPDNVMGPQRNRQKLTLVLRADDGFWRSYDDVASFRFAYSSDFDDFTTDDADDLGTGWTLDYTGTGGGFMHTAGGAAVWVDDPDNPILSGGRTVVARRDSFTTPSDNQVIEVELGSFPEWSFPDNAYNDVWGRMPTTGTPGDDGVRLRVGIGWIRLSYFVSGVETVLRERPMLIPPLPGTRFSLVCGYESDSRMFKVLRNGSVIMQVKETGTGSQLGASFRGAGFGMHAGAAILTQATPSTVRGWNSGDNVATHTQSGFVRRINVGDQPMYDRYTCYGPGTFKIGNGPNATDFIEFGPLLPNQIAQIRSDPGKRGVVDLTSTPPSPQELTLFQQALKDLLDFAAGNNTSPLITAIESIFGVTPPQGNLYSLLKGRFSSAAAIPAKPAGRQAVPYFVPVSITNGTADSMIVAAGTPLRRYPQ